MQPVVSTAVFGHFPDPSQLVALRHFGLLSLCVDLDRMGATSAAMARATARAAGITLPAAHLPRQPDVRHEWTGLDVATELGARVVVVHARPDVAALGRLCDAATERGLVVAVEIGAAAGATVEALTGALSALGFEHGRHGLCLDTSRLRPPPEVLDGLRPRLRWVEVSSGTETRSHAPPAMDDHELRRLVSRLSPGLLCYEIVSFGTPGEAQVLAALGAINLWHRGGGDTTFTHPVVP